MQFCGLSDSLTGEHVLPQWAFNHCPEKFFNTPINGKGHKYKSKEVPACANCNNSLLGYTDRYIKKIIERKNFSKTFSAYEMSNVIRWLEFIDYKFQILDFRIKYVSTPDKRFIPYIAPMPIAMFRANHESPFKVYAELRKAAMRILRKDKTENLNSLLIFETKNPDFHFIHNSGEFIFLEMPFVKVALFYFFDKEYSSSKDAHNRALKIFDAHYSK